ncbi:MAG: DUF3576 domain-containing protein [Magnetococcales bacterium]|jgi:hypothetical protein|nr:DUF3576 domain-containing protein [Magnetococcales bacterium]
MKIKFMTVALTALALGTGGCSSSLWSSPNTLEQQKLAKFGHKKAKEDAMEGIGENSSADLLGQESTFNFGGGGGGAKLSQEQVRLNKLYAGAMDVVMELPIQVANREGGFISTDWKIDPNDPKTRYRINIRLSGQAPYGDVKVVVLRQGAQGDGSWHDGPSDAESARQIEKAIRKKAQDARPPE